MKKNIIRIIEGILIIFNIYFHNMIKFSNISLYLFLFLIIVLFEYTNNKKINLTTKIFSVVLSLIFTLGNISIVKYKSNVLEILIILVELFGSYYLFNRLLVVLEEWFSKLNITTNNKKINKRKFMLISSTIGFLCLLPYFLKYYPGIVSNDSYWQLTQAMKLTTYSDHHPWVHTLFIKLFYDIGMILTGKTHIGVALYTIFQMIFASLTFSYVVYTLYNNKINKYIVVLVWMFFFLLPYNGIYSVTMWKDIPFSYITLILTTFLLDHYRNKLSWNKQSKIIFTILTFFFALFRSNGFIAYIIFLLILFILYRKEFKVLKWSILISFCLIMIVKIPLSKIFNVSSPDFVESLSIPLQQIVYVIDNNGSISEDELKELSKICDLKRIKEDRKDFISNPIKWNIRDNDKEHYLEKNKLKFLKLWISLGIKNPKQYWIAYVKQTSGYWYHNYGKYWVYVETHVTDGDYGNYELFNNNFLPKKISKILDLGLDINSTIHYKLWSNAMGFYLIIISLFIMIKKKRNILALIPTLAVVLTLLIATPVANEFRYSYCVFLCFIVILLYSLINDNYDEGSFKNEGKRKTKDSCFNTVL